MEKHIYSAALFTICCLTALNKAFENFDEGKPIMGSAFFIISVIVMAYMGWRVK